MSIVQRPLQPYIAELLERPVNNLEVTQPAPFGPRVLTEVKTGAPSGTYTVFVTDGAGKTVSAEFVIEK